MTKEPTVVVLFCGRCAIVKESAVEPEPNRFSPTRFPPRPLVLTLHELVLFKAISSTKSSVLKEEPYRYTPSAS